MLGRRIVLVVPAFPQLSETFIVSKFLGLLEKGWDVHIHCRHSDPTEWNNFTSLISKPELRRRVHRSLPTRPMLRQVAGWPVVAGRIVARPGFAFYHLKALKRLGWRRCAEIVYVDSELCRLRPDILHFEFGTLATERMYLKSILNCKVVVSFRGYDLNMAGLQCHDYYSEVWDKADTLHLLGKDLWLRAQRRGCPTEKPHRLIPPAVDTNYFKRSAQLNASTKSTSRNRPRILSVGRLEWKKGYEFAIQALRKLKDAGIDFEYNVIGGGSQMDSIAFACHQLGVTDHVNLLGPRAQTAVRDYMENTDIFLHLAVSEGFCNSVLEAQAMELPVVCSDADGLSENVMDGASGFVVRRRDAQAAAEKLIMLCKDPELRTKMGRAGRQRVINHFRIEDQIQAFNLLYSELLQTRSGTELQHRGEFGLHN